MTEITGEMMLARDKGWHAAALMPALHRNREVWTALSAACASPGNGLPDDLRASIISLSLWVGRFTSEVMRGNEQIDPLIDVNMSIIGGLGAEQRL